MQEAAAYLRVENTHSGSGTVNDGVSDEDLMVHTKQGRRDAFVALVHRYQQPLVNFFRRMGARIDEAEDLVQETFMRLFAYRERYEPTSRFKNLLYVMGRHVWADMARKQARQPAVHPDALNTLTDPAPAHNGEHLDIQAALESLSEKLRAVVVLSVYQGLRQEAIAEILGIPTGTVKSRMHLALRQMKEMLSVESKPGAD